MKPVEGERAVLLQLREVDGKPARFEVEAGKINISRITECDVVGAPLKRKASVQFAPWENKFIKLSF